jgi:hypothetical protein
MVSAVDFHLIGARNGAKRISHIRKKQAVFNWFDVFPAYLALWARYTGKFERNRGALEKS